MYVYVREDERPQVHVEIWGFNVALRGVAHANYAIEPNFPRGAKLDMHNFWTAMICHSYRMARAWVVLGKRHVGNMGSTCESSSLFAGYKSYRIGFVHQSSFYRWRTDSTRPSCPRSTHVLRTHHARTTYCHPLPRLVRISPERHTRSTHVLPTHCPSEHLDKMHFLRGADAGDHSQVEFGYIEKLSYVCATPTWIGWERGFRDRMSFQSNDCQLIRHVKFAACHEL